VDFKLLGCVVKEEVGVYL